MNAVQSEPYHSMFSILLSVAKTFQYCKCWYVLFPPFVKKTARLQASPSEVVVANKRTTYPYTTCHYTRKIF